MIEPNVDEKFAIEGATKVKSQIRVRAQFFFNTPISTIRIQF